MSSSERRSDGVNYSGFGYRTPFMYDENGFYAAYPINVVNRTMIK